MPSHIVGQQREQLQCCSEVLQEGVGDSFHLLVQHGVLNHDTDLDRDEAASGDGATSLIADIPVGLSVSCWWEVGVRWWVFGMGAHWNSRDLTSYRYRSCTIHSFNVRPPHRCNSDQDELGLVISYRS